MLQIGDRGRLPRSSVGYNSSTARLRSMLGDLTTAITSLRSALASLGPQLSSGELSRRRDLVENLSRRAGQVRTSNSTPLYNEARIGRCGTRLLTEVRCHGQTRRGGVSCWRTSAPRPGAPRPATRAPRSCPRTPAPAGECCPTGPGSGKTRRKYYCF